jgi:hypothetical protein
MSSARPIVLTRHAQRYYEAQEIEVIVAEEDEAIVGRGRR